MVYFEFKSLFLVMLNVKEKTKDWAFPNHWNINEKACDIWFWRKYRPKIPWATQETSSIRPPNQRKPELQARNLTAEVGKNIWVNHKA
jgi:hypothetical protein